MPACYHEFESSVIWAHKAAHGPGFGDQKWKDPLVNSALANSVPGQELGVKKISVGRRAAGKTPVMRNLCP